MLKDHFRYILVVLLFSSVSILYAQTLATVEISEPAGVSRELEYVDVQIQVASDSLPAKSVDFYMQQAEDTRRIEGQLISKMQFPDENETLLHLIFPISIDAARHKTYLLKYDQGSSEPVTDLKITGQGRGLLVENSFYKADLTRSELSEGKNHDSGQLRELFVKLGFDVLLVRNSNRIHWAPNFQKKGAEEYSTIAGWDNPDYHWVQGPYLLFTQRRGPAPNHPEIHLLAQYFFYAGLPYFKFYSDMEMVENVWLTLLRNDEMTMDSLFTNVAYKKTSGEIMDLTFARREDVLKKDPVENTAPWLCFYNSEKGYGYGSIRLKYDISDKNGFSSPTYQAHTKISDGAGGGKYWNRRLIHDYPLFVPQGSRYREENAYLVFKMHPDDPFKEIKYWADCLQHPVKVKVIYGNKSVDQ